MRFLLPLLALLSFCVSGTCEYPTFSQAGFRDCMLIYFTPQRNPSDFRYLVACADRNGTPLRWGWDAFLFSRQRAGQGNSFQRGDATAPEWRGSIEDWFGEKGDVRAISSTIKNVEGKIGPPPSPRKAIFSIHYIKRNLDFGDFDGDGQAEDTTTDAGRLAIVEKYVDEILVRWRAARIQNMKLWGFYWMRESIDEKDHAFVRAVAKAVHKRGYRLLWIPHSRARGLDVAHDLGVDVVILQPNYAFLSAHKGEVRIERLISIAAKARKYRLGIEIECDYDIDTNAWSRAIFLDYLALGAPWLCGYGEAPRAYFQSFDVFPRCARSADPEARRAYDAVCDYLAMKYPQRPGWLKGARCRINGVRNGAALVDDRLVGCPRQNAATVAISNEKTKLSVDLPSPRYVGQVELGVAEALRGLRVATVRGSLKGKTLPRVGWRREMFDVKGGRHTFWIPFGATCDHFDVNLVQVPRGRIALDEISVVPASAKTIVQHLAYACPYTITPSWPRRYPDTGGMLTDGQRATRGWGEKKSVGFDGQRVHVALRFDRPRKIERVVVYCDDDPQSSVYVPSLVVAEFYRQPQVCFFADNGVLALDDEKHGADGVRAMSRSIGKAGLAAIKVPSAVATGGRFERVGASPTNGQSTSGRIEIPVSPPVECAQVVLSFHGGHWLMLSEIEAYEGGKNVARGKSYRVAPLPRADGKNRYADDGTRLTDGVIAFDFSAKELVGWSDGKARTIKVSLARPQHVREVAAHLLGGGRFGIVLPKRVVFQVSADGKSWKTIGEKQCRDLLDHRLFHERVAAKSMVDMAVRFVRFRLEPSKGWCMISEVEVR